jgi:hypothetical protein
MRSYKSLLLWNDPAVVGQFVYRKLITFIRASLSLWLLTSPFEMSRYSTKVSITIINPYNKDSILHHWKIKYHSTKK